MLVIVAGTALAEKSLYVGIRAQAARDRPRGVPLSEMAAGERITIYRITERAEEDKELLQYLDAQALVPGARATILEVSAALDSLTLDGPRGRATMGLRPAALIRVLPGDADRELRSLLKSRVPAEPMIGQLGDEALAALADKGARAKEGGLRLFRSSPTNADERGPSGSETSVGKVLFDLFHQHRGRRIVIACFASHIHRVQQIADAAAAVRGARGPGRHPRGRVVA